MEWCARVWVVLFRVLTSASHRSRLGMQLLTIACALHAFILGGGWRAHCTSLVHLVALCSGCVGSPSRLASTANSLSTVII